jgi:ABC-type tungstate transport system substrate-binding protein
MYTNRGDFTLGLALGVLLLLISLIITCRLNFAKRSA